MSRAGARRCKTRNTTTRRPQFFVAFPGLEDLAFDLLEVAAGKQRELDLRDLGRRRWIR
jgi:hypothetical protein